jgi:hypothetical protein
MRIPHPHSAAASLVKLVAKGVVRLGLGFILVESVLLTGCASQSLFDKLPQSMGGLPSGAPARPSTPPAYPAVHDMPPPRENSTLTETEQDKLQKELNALRDRTRARASSDEPESTQPNKEAKKKPAAARKTGRAGADLQPDGTKRNP